MSAKLEFSYKICQECLNSVKDDGRLPKSKECKSKRPYLKTEEDKRHHLALKQEQNEIEKNLSSISFLVKNITHTVDDHFENVRREVISKRENLLKQIHEKSNELIKRVNMSEESLFKKLNQKIADHKNEFENENKTLMKLNSDGRLDLMQINEFKRRNVNKLNEIQSFLLSLGLESELELKNFEKDNKFSYSNLSYKNQNLAKDVFCIENFSSNVRSLVGLSNGYLASGSGYRLEQGTINIWSFNLEEGTFALKQKLTRHTNSVLKLIELSNGMDIVSASADHTICIWSFNTGKKKLYTYTQTLKKHTGRVMGLVDLSRLCENKQMMASCAEDNTLVVWIRDENGLFEVNQTIKKHTSYVNSLILLSNNDLVSSSNDKTIMIWCFNRQQQEFLHKQTLFHVSKVWPLLELKSQELISGDSNGCIQVWSKQNEENEFRLLCNLQKHQANRWVSALIEMDNGDLVTSSFDFSIKIFSKIHPIKFDFKQALLKHTSEVNVLIKLTSNWFVSGSNDRIISFWRIE